MLLSPSVPKGPLEKSLFRKISERSSVFSRNTLYERSLSLSSAGTRIVPVPESVLFVVEEDVCRPCAANSHSVMELSVIQKSLNEHIALQALYNSQNLAKLLSLSQRQLQRAYRLHLGISPQKWLISQRINRAKLLLIQGKRIKVIAAELGYTNASYFCIQFKAETGLTPSMFTQINRPVAKV